MWKSLRDVGALIAIVGAVAAGCSKAPLAEKKVNGTGGTVASTDGTTIDLPAGAVSGDTSVTIQPTDEKPTTSAATLVTSSYLFGPEGIQFAKPVTVKIPFDASKIPAGGKQSDLVILTAPQGSANFVRLATHVEGNLLVADTMHFSVFTGALVPGAGDCAVSCAASESCSPSGCSAGPSSCTSSCDAQKYEVDCQADGSCMCVGSGATSATVNVGALSTTAPSDQVFNGYQMCGFPGALPCIFSCSNGSSSSGSGGVADASIGSGSGGSTGPAPASVGTLVGCGCTGVCMNMGNSLNCSNGTCTCGSGGVQQGVPDAGTTGPAPASNPVTFAFSCGDDLSALEAAWKNNCGYPGTVTVPVDTSSSSNPMSGGDLDGGIVSGGPDGFISGGGGDGGGTTTADAGGGMVDMSCMYNVMSAMAAPCGMTANCGGTNYSVQCMTGSVCQCMKDGMIEKMVNNLGCSDPMNTYKTLCGYP